MKQTDLEKIVEDEFRQELRCQESYGFTSPTWAYATVGHLAVMEGEYEKAELAFQKAISADSGNVFAHHFLGLTYADWGKNAQAIACFQRCIALNCGELILQIAEDNPYYHIAWCSEDSESCLLD